MNHAENAPQIRAELFSALPAEAARIRETVFVKEQGYAEEFDQQDADSLHVVLFVQGSAAATGRLFEEKEGIWHIGRVAVLKEYRKMGLGAGVLSSLETAARASGARKLVLGAQEHAVPFYEKQGYAVCGEKFLDQGEPHYPMEKILQ